MAEMVDTPCGKECVPLNELHIVLNGMKARLNTGDSDITELKKNVAVLLDVVKNIKETMDEISTILTAWNNIKGFNTVMSWIIAAAKGVAFVGAIIAGLAIAYAWVKAKVGAG